MVSFTTNAQEQKIAKVGVAAVFSIVMLVLSAIAMSGYTKNNWNYKDNFCVIENPDEPEESLQQFKCGPTNKTEIVTNGKVKRTQTNARVWIVLYWIMWSGSTLALVKASFTTGKATREAYREAYSKYQSSDSGLKKS